MVGGKIFFTDHPAHPGTERKQPPTGHFDNRRGEHMSVNMKRANASLNGTTALATTKLTTPMTHSIMADLTNGRTRSNVFFCFPLVERFAVDSKRNSVRPRNPVNPPTSSTTERTIAHARHVTTGCRAVSLSSVGDPAASSCFSAVSRLSNAHCKNAFALIWAPPPPRALVAMPSVGSCALPIEIRVARRRRPSAFLPIARCSTTSSEFVRSTSASFVARRTLSVCTRVSRRSIARPGRCRRRVGSARHDRCPRFDCGRVCFTLRHVAAKVAGADDINRLDGVVGRRSRAEVRWTAFNC